MALFIVALATILFSLSYPLYPGNMWLFAVFTVVANAMLLYGLRTNALFLDTFLAIFLWLGFWLKLVLRLINGGGYFVESGGDMTMFDQALNVAMIGLIAVMSGSWIRERFIFKYPVSSPLSLTHCFDLYKNHRKVILTLFVFFFILVATINFVLGIYQRGEIPKTNLPYGTDGIIKWLLIFGMASFSALILRFEVEINKKATLMPAVLAMLEAFMSSVSMMSRAMVINVSALGYGLLSTIRRQGFAWNKRYVASIFIIFSVLFALSVLSVNYLRANNYNIVTIESGTSQPKANNSFSSDSTNREKTSDSSEPGEAKGGKQVSSPSLIDDIKDKFQLVLIMTQPLFVDRWVGIEGVLGVLHHGELGWPLWQKAWDEKYSDNQISLYDQMIGSAYTTIDTTKHHFVNLPGMIAFLFYPGSYVFLFIAMTFVMIVASLFEIGAFKLSGNNMVLSALIGQIVVFRITNFGYVPGQSYLLLGSIILNVLMIFALERFLRLKYK